MRATLHTLRAAFACAFVLFPVLSSAATVTGRVRDASNNTYLLGATVTLRELNRDTTTGPDGAFIFNDVPAGSYTLTATFLGYADKSDTLTVAATGARPVEFALASEVTKLGAFVVEGNREGQARWGGVRWRQWRSCRGLQHSCSESTDPDGRDQSLLATFALCRLHSRPHLRRDQWCSADQCRDRDAGCAGHRLGDSGTGDLFG